MKDRGVVFLQAFLMACVCMVAYTGSAFADDDIDDSVLMGSFKLTPILVVSTEYNDNIYTEPTNKTGDFVTRVAPSVKAALQDQPHRLEVEAGAEQLWFADETQNHYLNFNLGFRDRYNFDPDLLLDVSGSMHRTHSLPGDDQANPTADASEPLPFTQYRAAATLHKSFARLKLSPGASLRRYDYGNVRRINGALIDQGDRDRTEYSFGGRIAHDVARGVEVFADLAAEPVDYGRESATDRDSAGGTYLAGLRYRPDRTLLAEAALGYLERDYTSIVYEDINTVDASIRIKWDYAPDSLLDLSYNRYIRESTDVGTGGALADDVRLNLRHALTEDWLLRGGLRFRNSAYQGGNNADNGISDRTDRYWAALMGLEYRLADRVSLIGEINHARNQSNRNDAEYKRNVFMLGLRTGL